ncbi:MAG: hypothetical protein WD872_20965, partial [Pirellulaceae bacterium]
HVNCASCHVEAGGGNAQINLDFAADRSKLNVLDVAPLHHKFGLENPRLIAPGDPARSVLLHRMAQRGQNSGQMPQIATFVVDEPAVRLMEEWIQSLAAP